MVLAISEYLSVPRPCENPKARVVCFPHSGGGASAFSSWPGLLEAEEIEVVAISPPGRERRAGQPNLTDWHQLVVEVCEALDSSGLINDVPYVFFGHSLGALIAFEVARHLHKELAPGRPRPVHLFVSGQGAPRTRALERDIPAWGRLHTLDDAGVIEATQAFGFLPPEVISDKDLMRAVIPSIKADFQMYEEYSPVDGSQPVPLDITALGGAEDAITPTEHLQTWVEETTGRFHGAAIFPGDHFFVDTSRGEVVDLLRKRILEAMDLLPRSVIRSKLKVPEICYDKLVIDRFEEAGAKSPESEAIVGENESVSYKEAVRRVHLMAAVLHKAFLHGVPNQIVALLMPHNETYVLSMLAIWKAAAGLIVVEAHFPPSLVKEVCEESKTVAAICSPQHAPKFEEVEGCETLVLEGDYPVQLESMLQGHTLDCPRPEHKDICILMFTSGTTGKPKTIAGSHRFVHVGQMHKITAHPFNQTDDCREAFNVMFVWEVCRPLILGQTSIIIPDEATLDPNLFVASLQKHRASRVLTTPSLLGTIMRNCATEFETLETMRTWIMCGEVLPMPLVAMFSKLLPTCKMVNDYSTWESGDVSYAQVVPRPAFEPSPAFAAGGHLAPDQCVAVIDPETKKAQPLGVVGELYVGGPGLSYGYYGSAELTASRFVDGFTDEMRELLPGGKWYKSGDSGRFVGEPPILEVRGRIDSTVKIRGFKVGIPVVEAAVCESTGVATCAVIPMYESPGIVDSLLCFLEPKEGVNIEEAVQNVKREAVQRIPRWMIPTFFKPMTQAVSGGEARKLDRKHLAKLFDLATLRQEQAQDGQEEEDAGRQGEDEDFGVQGILRKVWAKALNLNPQTLDPEENFFDLGGHSTLAAKIATELASDYGLPVTVLDIYSHSTLKALMAFLDSKTDDTAAQAESKVRVRPRFNAAGEAAKTEVVGLAGRFPGAANADAFWTNLVAGTVSATFLSKDFLRAKGVPEATLNHKDFVPCGYKIEDADKFDHAFFGIGRHEASLMDPQHRVFIETAWAALEDAALLPRGGLADSFVGVYAAAGIDGYLVHHLEGLPLRDSLDPQDIFLAEIGNEKDYIATRVAYLLDFTGPAMNVNSACSSALVACAQGAAAIAAGQCDAAVAGASSITFPNLGFRYQDGLVNSIDGYVRPFDAAASGTVFGDSVGAVVLRRQENEAEHELTWGALRGFAVTNDGGQKAGYAAPSPGGQSQAVMGALRMLGEDAWSVSYVECHCTGTKVGDGIEIRGLLDAFAEAGGKRKAGEASVALGSVKGNIAHANCAAGATGLIKTLLLMSHRSLVPTANFSKLNPKIGLDGSPFFVNGESCAWKQEERPLRAGVSSFGIGGTNAHLVLQEASAAEKTQPEATVQRPAYQLLPLSARSPEALLRNAEELQGVLRACDDLDDLAYTLQAGRTAFPLRRAAVVETPAQGMGSATAEAVRAAMPDEEELEELEEAKRKPRVAFLFPGQGSQHFGMAKGLYAQVPAFQAAMDRCCELLAQPDKLGFDLRPLLFTQQEGAATTAAQEAFEKPSVLQPALFAVEWAMSEVFSALGLQPVAAAGHSLGEYVAAVVGGLLSLESAVAIVAARAKATEAVAKEGAMLSVSGLTTEELEEISKGRRENLWLAAENSPEHAVVSGEVAAVEALEVELKAKGRKCARLRVNRAFHSGLIAPAAEALQGLGLPQEREATVAAVPVASNFSGRWLSALQLKDGGYWVKHMRGCVRWRENAAQVLSQWQPAAMLEVGPGNTLCALSAKCVAQGTAAPVFVQAMRHPKSTGMHDVQALLQAVGQLWELGCALDWQALHTKVLGLATPPKLMRLPTYAFDRTRLWVNPERSVYVDSVEDPSPAAYSDLSQVTTKAGVQPKVLLRYAEQTPQEPAVRAYCLPFAGGSATVFAPWVETQDNAFEIVAVELPGRGGRTEEVMPSSAEGDEALLNELCSAILADLRGASYVLVGLSMGGNICASLALLLAQRGAPAPLALYVAGRRPPAMDPQSVQPIAMSNAELAEYAFAPPDVAASPEFAEHVVPMLRADLELDARLEQRLSALSANKVQLQQGVGLQLYCGVTDTVAPWQEATGWQRLVQQPLGMHYFPGGHEFMKEQRALLFTSVRTDALGRLLQKRATELAALASQGTAAVMPATPPPPPAQTASTAPDLPIYAVRWAQAIEVPVVEAAAPGQAFCLRLDLEAPAATLAEAVQAIRAGRPVLAACGRGPYWEPQPERRQAWHFLQLVQHLLREGCSGRLLLACLSSASGAMVAGASKAVAMEAAELRIQRLFLPWSMLETVEVNADQLLALADRHGRETDLWVKDTLEVGQVFAPRLEHLQVPSVKLPCLPRRLPGGNLPVFVITGATGGIGKAVLGWLLGEQGVQPEQLVLVRRPGGESLTGNLAQCRVVEVEKADQEALKEVLRPLRDVVGVMHLAGVLDDGVVQSMTEERLRKVSQPKCDLFSMLLRAAKALSWPLRWAVGFSSSSSLFGYPGQSNYCAANAVIDHMAAFNARCDEAPCPVMAINWGPWAEVGMAKEGTKAFEQAKQDGDTPLPTATALDCLAATLRLASQAQPATQQVCICDVNWNRSQWRQLPSVELLGEDLGPLAVAPSSREEQLEPAVGGDLRLAVQQFLLQQSKSGNGWKRAQGRSLHQLGLDSLEVVQVRNLFNRTFKVNVPMGLVADSSKKLGELCDELVRHLAP